MYHHHLVGFARHLLHHRCELPGAPQSVRCHVPGTVRQAVVAWTKVLQLDEGTQVVLRVSCTAVHNP